MYSMRIICKLKKYIHENEGTCVKISLSESYAIKYECKE